MAHKLLIVDDEPNLTVSLEFLFQESGYEIRVAADGEQALAQMAAFQPDLVLLDVMLPSIDGYEVLQKIREQPAWNRTRIVMLTAMGRDAEVGKGLALGADAYITKPFSICDLLDRVHGLLEG